MSLPVPLSVAGQLEGLRPLLLSLGMEPRVVDAALKACAKVAADHPELFANLHLVGMHIEQARRIGAHHLSGKGHLLKRRVQMGPRRLRLLFELAARSSLQQRGFVATRVAGNKRPRQNQLLAKEAVLTLLRSNEDGSTASISVAANAHRPNEMPLMRVVQRQDGRKVAQQPCGPEGARTFHFFFAAADAEPSQLQVGRGVSVCKHGHSQAHANVDGQGACHFIDAYEMVESVLTRDAYGAWSQSMNSVFVQQLLVAGNGAAALADDPDTEDEGDDEQPDDDTDGDSDDDNNNNNEEPSSAASSNKRARTDQGSSAAAGAGVQPSDFSVDAFFSPDLANYAVEENEEPPAGAAAPLDDGVAPMDLDLDFDFGAEPRVFGELRQHFGADV